MRHRHRQPRGWAPRGKETARTENAPETLIASPPESKPEVSGRWLSRRFVVNDAAPLPDDELYNERPLIIRYDLEKGKFIIEWRFRRHSVWLTEEQWCEIRRASRKAGAQWSPEFEATLRRVLAQAQTTGRRQ
jgi:hypothetical protein